MIRIRRHAFVDYRGYLEDAEQLLPEIRTLQMNCQTWTLGARVEVLDTYFVAQLRGWRGIIAEPPDVLDTSGNDHVNTYWVEFPQADQPGVVDGAEIEAQYLKLVV